MFALNAFKIWIVGVFLYVMSVQAGGQLIYIFSYTNPVTTYSALALIGGLILVIWPFVDGGLLLVQKWMRGLGLNKKKEDEKEG